MDSQLWARLAHHLPSCTLKADSGVPALNLETLLTFWYLRQYSGGRPARRGGMMARRQPADVERRCRPLGTCPAAMLRICPVTPSNALCLVDQGPCIFKDLHKRCLDHGSPDQWYLAGPDMVHGRTQLYRSGIELQISLDMQRARAENPSLSHSKQQALVARNTF